MNGLLGIMTSSFKLKAEKICLPKSLVFRRVSYLFLVTEDTSSFAARPPSCRTAGSAAWTPPPASHAEPYGDIPGFFRIQQPGGRNGFSHSSLSPQSHTVLCEQIGRRLHSAVHCLLDSKVTQHMALKLQIPIFLCLWPFDSCPARGRCESQSWALL